MNIYVGNLSYSTTEDDLRHMFEPYGEVTKANVIKDKFSGNSRGFGFVEMASNEEGQAAISALNGKDVGGRKLNVNEARPREDRGDRGDRGDRRDRRGGGGGDRRDW
jgi:cold-inducible RNA-binding protein